MADRLEPHVREAFDAETRRIMARRVPGGSFEITSRPGAATCVSARVPVESVRHAEVATAG